jgi:hypothetical protein
MSETYTGSGQALIVSSKCNKLVPFISSYKWSIGGDGSDQNLAKIEYNNSFIGSRTFSAVYAITNVLGSDWVEIGSDGLLNFNTSYLYDQDTDTFFIYVTITGVYKKCNYSSYELDVLNNSLSAASKDSLKKKSRSSEDFHKLLNSNSELKKRYLQIKAKLGK